jgi:hypothetical protein
MASHREQVLSALFGRLRTVPGATVRRNEALLHLPRFDFAFCVNNGARQANVVRVFFESDRTPREDSACRGIRSTGLRARGR